MASSLHALLSDYGYRWGRTETGATVWSRLATGDVDTASGLIYGGPKRYALRCGDRIVVDEAGMVERQTANALTELALKLHGGIAMVGDTHQALPVGHAGAMESATRHASASVELDTVHRFRDPAYAALTLRLRDVGDPADAQAVAGELMTRGHLERADHHDAARDRMVEEYFTWHARGKRIALVSATNGEADAINDAIQQRRVDDGELDPRIVAWGMGEQRILVGDAVQTRRNYSRTGVENRAQWIVQAIREQGIDLASSSDSGELRRVSAEYTLEHLQLAYASTVHGHPGRDSGCLHRWPRCGCRGPLRRSHARAHPQCRDRGSADAEAAA